MTQISELQSILSHFLDWNKPRITCLVQIIQALFRVRTVNLTQIAEAFQASAKETSTYRRLQRFFKGFSFDMSFIVILVAKLFMMDEKCVLIMDRTNWKWGKKHINILMLSIEHFGIGIPLFWVVLDKGGGSSSEDRMNLLKRVIQRLGPENIQVLLADREFIGEVWFRFLITENLPFVIRVKQCFMVGGIRNGYEVPIRELLKELGHKKRHINHRIVLWGNKLFASVEHAKGAKEPMIVVSNNPFPNPLVLYRWRWGIETLFGCLKSRGFRMEDTHMVDPIKIEKLIFILAIAFCWAYKTGELSARLSPIIVKKHGRKARSIFRLGLNLIRSKLLWLEEKIDPYLSLLRYFTPLKPGGSSI
jgi:Transposase DDE domain